MRPSMTVLMTTLALLAAPRDARAVDTSITTGPDVSAARARIKARDYAGALVELRRLEYTAHPDVNNLMGFIYRKLGDRERAMVHYNKALSDDPHHRGALEYQGELFLELGQPDRARANRGRLRLLCPMGCEELEDLDAAIKQAAPKR